MKKTFKFSAIIAALAMAFTAAAHDYTATATSSIGAVSNTSATSYAGTGGGLSISGAFNSQTAGVGSNATGSAGSGLFGVTRFTEVNLGGVASTSGLSSASNFSVGNATGAAAAAGVSTANVAAVGAGHTTTNGPTVSASGDASTVTATGATAGRNGSATVGAGANADFSAGASASSFTLGPIKTAAVDSHATTFATTTPTLSLVIGNAGITIQNEAAANALSQAKVGVLQSNN